METRNEKAKCLLFRCLWCIRHAVPVYNVIIEIQLLEKYCEILQIIFGKIIGLDKTKYKLHHVEYLKCYLEVSINASTIYS